MFPLSSLLSVWGESNPSFVLPCLLPRLRIVTGGFVKDVIVLIKASIKLIRLSHIPTLYGSIPLEKCEIHVNMKCIVLLQARAITRADINFKSSPKGIPLSQSQWRSYECDGDVIAWWLLGSENGVNEFLKRQVQ